MSLAYAGWRGRVQCAIGLVMLALAMLSSPAFAQASAAKAPRTILVMGDSLSAAYGLSASQGWVALTADRVVTATTAKAVAKMPATQTLIAKIKNAALMPCPSVNGAYARLQPPKRA